MCETRNFVWQAYNGLGSGLLGAAVLDVLAKDRGFQFPMLLYLFYHAFKYTVISLYHINLLASSDVIHLSRKLYTSYSS